jgi:hypothetical protein
MKLEYGKRYVDHKGDITGPLIANEDITSQIERPFQDSINKWVFTEDGYFWSSRRYSAYNIVKEYEEPTPEVIDISNKPKLEYDISISFDDVTVTN